MIPSAILLIIVQVAYSCTYELRPYLDLLLQMLLLEDSWQNHRIHNALKGLYDMFLVSITAINYVLWNVYSTIAVQT